VNPRERNFARSLHWGNRFPARHGRAAAGLKLPRICTGLGYWLKSQLANVRRHRDNPHEPIHSCVFSPSDGQVPPHRERSSEWACCILGRCFVVARRGELDTRALRMSSAGEVVHAIPSPTTHAGRKCWDVYQPAGIASRRHHKTPSTVRARIDAANGPMSGPHPCTDGALSAPGAVVLSQEPHEQACRPIYPSGPRNGRLEVECGRSAGGSLQQYGDSREEPSEASGAGCR
jgi:hypothetical protein